MESETLDAGAPVVVTKKRGRPPKAKPPAPSPAAAAEPTFSPATLAAKAPLGGDPAKRAALDAEMKKLTEEYRWLGPDAAAGHGPAIARRHELAKELKRVSSTLHRMEPDVEVDLPVSPFGRGHAYQVGTKKFLPGRYTVKASVAQHLMFMVSAAQRQDQALLRQNGYDVELKTIGERARYADIARED